MSTVGWAQLLHHRYQLVEADGALSVRPLLMATGQMLPSATGDQAVERAQGQRVRRRQGLVQLPRNGQVELAGLPLAQHDHVLLLPHRKE